MPYWIIPLHHELKLWKVTETGWIILILILSFTNIELNYRKDLPWD